MHPIEDGDWPQDRETAWQALSRRDRSLDGRMFVGVTSTGVYCRPICRVRTPRLANCRFFRSAAAAEAASFRPCLKCRPEIAPGLSLMDSSRVLADTAARWLDEALRRGEAPSMPSIAARLGVTERHLRRIFAAAHGVAPRDWIATRRLLLAKQLLTDTRLPVTEVALASGFGSLRRFHAAFAHRYSMAPGALRRAHRPEGEGPWLRLAYRPPLDAPGLFGHFERRTVAGVEVVDTVALTWRRTASIATGDGGHRAGWIEARLVPEACELRVRVHGDLAGAVGEVIARLRHLFDLDADPMTIDAALSDPALIDARPGHHRPGVRMPGSWDGFEAGARVILGQQVTVRAARTLLQRLVDRFGPALDTGDPALHRCFPDAATIGAADPAEIGRLGIVRQRVGALQALARAVASGELPLTPSDPLEATLERLQALPGIGPWTAQLIALRALRHADAWPAADIGLMNALGTRDPAEVERRGEPWRPWRGYALMRLWNRMETL